AGEFMQMLGIDPSEDVYFGWIAEYGLQSEALPPRWASGVDAQTGRIYYVNTDDGT
ncbi:mettl21b, partial [Symbiodinium microadriaticum]